MTFQNRFFPATMRAKQLIDDGLAGSDSGFPRLLPARRQRRSAAPLRWKLTAAAGGGVIADLASHVLDLVDWLIGPFRAVMAATQIAYPERPAAGDPAGSVPVDAEDCVMLLADAVGRPGHDRGHEARHRQRGRNAAGDPRLPRRAALQRHGPAPPGFHDATARRQPLGGLRGWNRIDAGQRYPPPAAGFPSPKAAIGWIRSHVACLANFLQAVAGAARRAGPGAGIRVQHLMDCAAIGRGGGWMDV